MWTDEKALKQQLEKQWQKGIFLTSLISGETLFPLKLKLVKPNSNEITSQFEQVRKWVAALSKLDFISIEWKNINHRIQGEQRIPNAVYIHHIEDVLGWLRKQNVYRQFQALIEITQAQQPELLQWLAKYPFKALELAEQWQNLLKVVAWRKENATEKCYLRQVVIENIHSKFIEKHKAVLSELFDLVLPANAIQTEFNTTSQFNARYGFLDKPQHIRFRNLDPKRAVFSQILQSDLSLDINSFSALNPTIQKVIIVENEINFLALPKIENCWAIFGAGYGWTGLAKAKWLNNCEIYYWGDIDTHGFAILNQLRHYFPKAISFLMDNATLLAYKSFWSTENKPQLAVLDKLTEPEQAVYQALQQNVFGEKIRLEQEFIPFDFVERELQERFTLI